MVSGANKVFCGTENGVCELTKDTVYVHPSTKQCSWTPGSTPIKTRTLSPSSTLLCTSDDLPMSDTLYKLTIKIVSINGSYNSGIGTRLTGIVAYSESQNASSVCTTLSNGIGPCTYIILIMKNVDGYLSYYSGDKTTGFEYIQNTSQGTNRYYDITSLYISLQYKSNTSIYWINFDINEGYSILNL